MKKLISVLCITSATLLLSACSGFFDKDNVTPPAPLPQYHAEVKPRLLWATKAGAGFGSEELKLTPALSGDAIYTTSSTGQVTALNRLNGKILWQTKTGFNLTTGPGVGDGVVAAGSQRGRLIVLNASDGKMLWEKTVSGEFLASPAVHDGIIVIKTMDGAVRGLALKDGEERWTYQMNEPTLVLRGSSSPVIKGHEALIGFANGKLAKLDLRAGKQRWVRTIAEPEGAYEIQRMSDIDADPLLFKNYIYAATYQGKITALDWHSGKQKWTHNISSYAGMSADDQSLYIADTQSLLWSFNANHGTVNWTLNDLHDRGLTGPVVFGNYIVVGDAEGYLHWINAKTGQIVGRENIGSSISVSPLVRDGVVYAMADNGKLVAMTTG